MFEDSYERYILQPLSDQRVIIMIIVYFSFFRYTVLVLDTRVYGPCWWPVLFQAFCK